MKMTVKMRKAMMSVIARRAWATRRFNAEMKRLDRVESGLMGWQTRMKGR